MAEAGVPRHRSKLEYCAGQCLRQLRDLTGYLNATMSALEAQQASASAQQLFLRSVVVLLQSSVEAYFRCIVSIGTFWDPMTVRQHLASVKPDQARNVEGMPASILTKWALWEVAFDSDAKRLKGIIKALFKAEVFPDSATESCLLDLVRVRNIIVHQVDSVDERNAGTVNYPGIVVERAKIGEAQFFQFSLPAQFVKDCTVAFGHMVISLQKIIDSDPRFRIDLPEV